MFDETLVLNEEGALVIPVEIREELGWKPGTQFCVEREGEAIHLTPRTNRSRLVYKNGHWVVPARGKTPLKYGVDEDREERIQELLDRN